MLDQSKLALPAWARFLLPPNKLPQTRQLGKKPHSFIISKFPQVRSLGLAELGSLPRVSQDWHQGARWADSFLELGWGWGLEVEVCGGMSSFRVTWLWTDFRCLSLDSWGCSKLPEAHAAPGHMASPCALSHFQLSHQKKDPVPLFFIIFLRFYIFIHERHRKRGRDTGRGRSRLHEGNLM